MHRVVETVLLAALAGLTWVLVVVLVGMVLAVAAGPSVMGLVQLGLVAMLAYSVVPLYRSIKDGETFGKVLNEFGTVEEMAVTGVLVVAAVQPLSFPGKAIIGFPLFNAPSMLYPAVVEVRGLLGGRVGAVLSVAAVWLQVVWSYLIVEGGYGAVTAVFKRWRHEG